MEALFRVVRQGSEILFRHALVMLDLLDALVIMQGGELWVERDGQVIAETRGIKESEIDQTTVFFFKFPEGKLSDPASAVRWRPLLESRSYVALKPAMFQEGDKVRLFFNFKVKGTFEDYLREWYVWHRAYYELAQEKGSEVTVTTEEVKSRLDMARWFNQPILRFCDIPEMFRMEAKRIPAIPKSPEEAVGPPRKTHAHPRKGLDIPVVDQVLGFLCRDGKILLGRKKRGFGVGKLNGLGGKVEKGEFIPDTLDRETTDESGLVIVRFKELGIVNFRFKKKWVVHRAHLFLIEDWIGFPQESEEMGDFRFYGREEIPYDQMWLADQFFLPLVIDGKLLDGKFFYDEEGGKILRHRIVERRFRRSRREKKESKEKSSEQAEAIAI